jgi:hypothetical protein
MAATADLELSAPLAAQSPRTSVADDARRLLWLSFAFFVAGVGIGVGWDRRWHATHPFEDFFSPPHLVIYTNVLLAAAVAVYVTFNKRLRAVFGHGETLPLFSFRVPGPLMLLGVGFVTIGLGGLCDGVWHTLFGLDETGWSLPHAMLGHGIMLVTLGFVATRVVLPGRLTWFATGLLGFVLLTISLDLIGGPILRNPPPNALRAVAALPVLANDAAYQHTSRIYLTWNLDRTNWLYLPLIAFGAGFGLRLLQRLSGPRDRWLVVVAAIGLMLAAVDGEARGWGRLLLVPPFFPAAAGFAVLRVAGVRGRWAWLGAGWGACLVSLVFVPNVALAIACAPLAVLGAGLGTRILDVVDTPRRQAVVLMWLVIGVAMPVASGALDLYLRQKTA